MAGACESRGRDEGVLREGMAAGETRKDSVVGEVGNDRWCRWWRGRICRWYDSGELAMMWIDIRHIQLYQEWKDIREGIAPNWHQRLREITKFLRDTYKERNTTLLCLPQKCES